MCGYFELLWEYTSIRTHFPPPFLMRGIAELARLRRAANVPLSRIKPSHSSVCCCGCFYSPSVNVSTVLARSVVFLGVELSASTAMDPGTLSSS